MAGEGGGLAVVQAAHGDGLAGFGGLERVLEQVAEHARQERLIADERAAPEPGAIAIRLSRATTWFRKVRTRASTNGRGSSVRHWTANTLFSAATRMRWLLISWTSVSEATARSSLTSSSAISPAASMSRHRADAAGRVQDVVEEHALQELAPLLVGDVGRDEQDQLVLPQANGVAETRRSSASGPLAACREMRHS